MDILQTFQIIEEVEQALVALLAEGVLQAEAISIMVKYVPTAISLVTLLNSVIGNMATLLAIDSTNHKELQLII